MGKPTKTENKRVKLCVFTSWTHEDATFFQIVGFSSRVVEVMSIISGL